jgi:hypothetical protein
MKFLPFGVLISITIGCTAPQNDTGADLTSADSPATDQVSRLTLDGQQILDKGVPILLRGWNWGQWNTVLAGDLVNQGYPDAQPGDRSDGGDAVDQGANVVRILLRWWGEYAPERQGNDRWDHPIDSRQEPGMAHVRSESLTLLDFEISEATSHGLWVVLAVDSNCGQESPSSLDPHSPCTDGTIQPANFANDSHMKQEFQEVWTFLANRYKNHDHIAMYEILPEPQFGCHLKASCDYAAVRSFYTDLIGTIRGIDTRTPILIGPGNGYSMKNIDEAWLTEPTGTNPNKLIYTADMLSHEALSMADLPGFLTFGGPIAQGGHNVPLFVQQVGIDQSTVDVNDPMTTELYLGQVSDVLSALNAPTANLGWTWWTYREQSGTGHGYAPWYLTGPHDDWSKSAANGLRAMISSFFPN